MSASDGGVGSAQPAFFGFMGASLALILASVFDLIFFLFLIFDFWYISDKWIDLGAAIGTSKAGSLSSFFFMLQREMFDLNLYLGVGIAAMGPLNPEAVMKNIIPVGECIY
jgi:hypothetical protein